MSLVERIKQLLTAMRPASKWDHLDAEALNEAIHEAFLEQDWELHAELVEELEDRYLWEVKP